jgi:hypothetical protein
MLQAPPIAALLIFMFFLQLMQKATQFTLFIEYLKQSVYDKNNVRDFFYIYLLEAIMAAPNMQ